MAPSSGVANREQASFIAPVHQLPSKTADALWAMRSPPAVLYLEQTEVLIDLPRGGAQGWVCFQAAFNGACEADIVD